MKRSFQLVLRNLKCFSTSSNQYTYPLVLETHLQYLEYLRVENKMT